MSRACSSKRVAWLSATLVAALVACGSPAPLVRQADGGSSAPVAEALPAPTDTVAAALVGSDAEKVQPSVVVEALAWPESAHQSKLELAIGLPAGVPPLYAYTDRAQRLLEWCMRSQGVAGYEAGGSVANDAEFRLLTEEALVEGAVVVGGCDAWSMSNAFPGNYFGSIYAELIPLATARSEYVQAVQDYDSCLLNADVKQLPDVEGMDPSAAAAAMTEYHSVTSSCNESTRRSIVERELEILLGDAFAELYPDAIDQYSRDVLSLIGGE